MKRPTRPSADQTRKKILLAAKKVFLEKGFDAAYIKDIANIAKVNTNLIFHHFTNKETLWQKVKSNVMGQDIETPDYDLSSAKTFFKSVLDYRFSLYRNDHDLVKLIQWQQLTEKESSLIGTGNSSPSDLLGIVREFQEKGEITNKVDTDQIVLFIIFNTYPPFWQKVIPFDEQKIEQYKEMIFNMCCSQFIT